MPWTISRNAVNQSLFAHVTCPKCKQSMEGESPDITFRHCGGKVEFLTIAQRDLLGGRGNVEAVLAEQARANFSALEAAKNQQTPHHFNEAAAFEAVRAAVIRDAEALEAKRREQAEYDLRTPLPRQTVGAPQREQYIPGVHET